MLELADIRETFEIHTNISPVTCPVCGEDLGKTAGITGEKIDGAINHVLTHGWRLLHVGAEWAEDSDGKSISHTVAFLGKGIGPTWNAT